MNSKITKIAIFSSGSGSNAQKIMEYFQANPDIQVSLLLSNNNKAFALERAKNMNVNTLVFNKEDFFFSDKILSRLKSENISWLILAGFLWMVPENLINAFPNRIINIHPALLPNYGGKGMYGMFVHRAVCTAKEKETGISIHYVNSRYDEGEIIFQAKCLVDESDTAEDISRKVQILEHRYFPQIIEEEIRKSALKK